MMSYASLESTGQSKIIKVLKHKIINFTQVADFVLWHSTSWSLLTIHISNKSDLDLINVFNAFVMLRLDGYSIVKVGKHWMV